jgi:hypothetical protein
MLKVALFVAAAALFIACPSVMAQSDSSDQPEKPHPCPKSPLEASKLATEDVQKFKKMYFSGTWTGFLYQFRSKYAECPAFIKQVYVDTARKEMNAGSSQVGSFQNMLKK